MTCCGIQYKLLYNISCSSNEAVWLKWAIGLLLNFQNKMPMRSLEEIRLLGNFFPAGAVK